MIVKGSGSAGSAEPRTLPPDGRPLADQPQWRQDFPIDAGTTTTSRAASS